MSNALSKIVIFAAGVTIGSVVTWKLVETKYKKITEEEIESVKEAFSRKKVEEVTEEPNDDIYGEDEKTIVKTDAVMTDYRSIAKIYDDNIEVEKEECNMERPYVITPEEYEESEYTQESLDYYEGDGVLVDPFGDIVENVEEMVGLDFASYFGKYEKDTVYVRNDIMETDFEILRDYRKYSEIS
jgi:hypothetical protein